MNVLRVFLSAVAACFGGVAVGGLLLAFMGHWLVGGALVAAGAPLAYAVFRQARTYTIKSTEDQKAQFEDAVRALAERNGGIAPVARIAEATGVSREQVDAKMRELIGRGVFEMDFAEDGEMQFKLTPADESRARITAMRERT
jgi:hypothetical protein